MARRRRADEGGREIRRRLNIRRGKVGGFFHGSRRAIRGGLHLGDREVGGIDHYRRREEEGPGHLETAGPDRRLPDAGGGGSLSSQKPFTLAAFR